jgi:hypothetical protein
LIHETYLSEDRVQIEIKPTARSPIDPVSDPRAAPKAEPAIATELTSDTRAELKVEPAQVARPAVRLDDIQVIAGRVDPADVEHALRLHERELVRCFTKTQRGAFARRALLIRVVSSSGTQTLHAVPEDAPSTEFLSCMRAIESKIPLPISQTAAINILSFRIGAIKRGTP